MTFEKVKRFGYNNEIEKPCGDGCGVVRYSKTDLVPNWIYPADCYYWIERIDDTEFVWAINDSGYISRDMSSHVGNIRPVVELYKTDAITKLES